MLIYELAVDRRPSSSEGLFATDLTYLHEPLRTSIFQRTVRPGRALSTTIATAVSTDIIGALSVLIAERRHSSGHVDHFAVRLELQAEEIVLPGELCSDDSHRIDPRTIFGSGDEHLLAVRVERRITVSAVGRGSGGTGGRV